MLNLLIGAFPGILFTIIFYLLDKNKKEINIVFLLATFIFGAISSYLAYRLEMHYGSYFKKVAHSNLLEVYFYALVGVAIFEEGLKLFFAFLFSRLDKVKKKSNIFTYCITSSAGFLTFENVVFYSMRYGISTSIRRLFNVSFEHIWYAIIMGYFLSKFNIKNIKSYFNLLLSFIVPSMVHALYNTFLYQEIESLYIYSWLHVFIFGIICVGLVYKVYKYY